MPQEFIAEAAVVVPAAGPVVIAAHLELVFEGDGPGLAFGHDGHLGKAGRKQVLLFRVEPGFQVEQPLEGGDAVGDFFQAGRGKILAGHPAYNPGPGVDGESKPGEAADAQAVLENAGILHVADGNWRLQEAEARDFAGAAEEGQRHGIATAQVAGSGGRSHVAEGLGIGSARVVAGHLQLLNVHGDFRMAAGLGETVGAFGEERADSLAVCRELNQLFEKIGAAEAQFQVTGLFRRQVAAFKKLHGAGHRSAEGNGVETELVGQVVGPDDGVHVVYVADRAGHDRGFVFGPLTLADRAAIPFDRRVALAANRAEVAGAGFFQVVMGDVFAAHALELLFVVLHILEVSVRQHVDEVDEQDEARGPELAQEALGDGCLLHQVECLVQAGAVAGFVGDGDAFLAANADGFKVLAAEDGAGPAASVDPVFLVGHGRVADQVFPSRSNDESTVGVAGDAVSGQDVGRLMGIFAPEVAGVADFHFLGADVDENRVRRPAAYDQSIVASRLKAISPGSARVGGANVAGKRRFIDHMPAGGGRCLRADKGRGSDNDDIVRTERVGFWVHPVVEELCPEPPPSQIEEHILRLKRHYSDFSGAEVHLQHPAMISRHTHVIEPPELVIS